MVSNFEFLSKYWPEIAQLGNAAELYLYSDANTCIYKLGQLGERVTFAICVFEKIEVPEELSQANRIKTIKQKGLLPQNIDDILYALRKARNDAVHSGSDSYDRAKTLLHMAFNLCTWFMEVYGDWSFSAPEYHQPEDMSDTADYNERLQAQEDKIKNLMEAVEAIRTAASNVPTVNRAQQSNAVSDRLPITTEENDYLDKEQIRIDVTVLPAINYALQQNGIQVIQSIFIINNSNETLNNIDLKVTASPDLCLPFERRIDCLPANKTLEVTDLKLILNAEFLAGITEKITGNLIICLSSEEEIIAIENVELTVLAFDEWHGSVFHPELLVSFITPNHPTIAKIIARATEFMGKWTGDTSMDAYQSQDPNRVLSQAAAIFASLKEQNIAYVVNPASYEKIGQRVRLCDMVLQYKLGTCLDLTLLYASCLEYIGLNPILLLENKHIFIGVWLADLLFPEPVQDDASLITKRLASGVNEIAVIESTCITSGDNTSFDDARTAGEHNLFGEEPIEYFVDVRRARLSGITPLPHRILTNEGWHIEHETFFGSDNLSAPKKLNATIDVIPNANYENIPKKTQWERKLLDLGLRNKLINLRFSKTLIPILASSLDELDDALSRGSDFSILPRPSDLSVKENGFESINELGNAAGIINAEFQNNRLRSSLNETDLVKAIKDLYRSSKTSLEENGANTLYLALGLIRWYESKRSTAPRYAPIVLIPIEIVRKNASIGYVIRLRDDEPQMNITILEKLKQDFGIVINGIDPLPTDEYGTDIRKVFTILRKAIMEQSKWDVLESAYLGTFSFSQFVMWNDIRNRTDDLIHNKIVHSLIEGKLSWDAKPMEIGDHVPEDNVLLPMPADASQLYAIEAACNGESFVLHGPPGTGKSQTITSLIVNALAKGKSVLFVAEKMAALEVVQKRLDSIGIGPFCLELHSNKSKKKDVLEQLRQVSEVTRDLPAEQFAIKAEQIAKMRSELDVYAQQLHKILPCGKSIYGLINEYEEYQNALYITPFAREYVKGLDSNALERHRILLERMIAAAKEIGHPFNHPLAPVALTQYSQSLRVDLLSTINSYLGQLNRIAPSIDKFIQITGEKEITSSGDLDRLVKIASHTAFWFDVPQAWVQAEFPYQYFKEISWMAQHYSNTKELLSRLQETFHKELFLQDGERLYAEYKLIAGKWFLPKTIGMNRMAKRISVMSKSPLDKKNFQKHLVDLRDYQSELKAANELFAKYEKDLDYLYIGEETDWRKISQLATTANSSARELHGIYGSDHFMHTYCKMAELRDCIYALLKCFPDFIKAKNCLYSLLNIREYCGEGWLKNQVGLCNDILVHSDSLKEWITFESIASEVKKQGLESIVIAYINGAKHNDIIPAYEKAILFALISDAIDMNNTLSTFSGVVFNEKVEQYKRIDHELTILAQKEAYCRLASKVPNFTQEAAHSSELGILQRLIKSNGRGTSIRKLFEQIPNLLPRLCPCMLMSPISAAQYLDPRREPFDIVVFDEASQLPTCKAVGVLARGKDAVIVGDPKQLPPTSFFVTNAIDEDNLDLEDLDSILDDCLALNMPQSHLLWHYRSRHESLIAFSNRKFYDNKLLTFPSVNDRESKVSLVHIDGIFERGKTRENHAEAIAVIAELKRRCHDINHSKLSVGVVTFNISQQNLIDDLLNDACQEDPELEKWAYNSSEPVFIKNLENVQGDERDVILFSIGYGPDQFGKVYMNFGPLNREGGWRRLNVAVSRARFEMIVYSTLCADQIDLTKTSSEGVATLRAFLEYAEGHKLIIDENSAKYYRIPHAGIVATICNALKEKGFDTDMSVGHSKYRIDIGIIDPKNPDEYILGILLDGPAYGTSKTTRDREIAQVNVLNGLGWRILRIWSMDWWDNKGKELNRIINKLDELKNGITKQEDKASDLCTVDEFNQPQTNGCNEIINNQSDMQSYQKLSVPAYAATKLQNQYVSPDDFLVNYTRDIQQKIQIVISDEAPINEGMLVRRVVQSFGIARAGNRIQDRMNTILRSMNVKVTKQDGQKIYWRQDQNPDTFIGLRASGEQENRRDIRDVPIQEIANAIYTVLYEQISMSEDDLVREAAKLLNYTRLGGNVISILTSSIKYAKSQGGIVSGTNGTLVLSADGMARASQLSKEVKIVPTYKSISDTKLKPPTQTEKLTWEEYYDKLNKWSESKLISKISSLGNFEHPDEIAEAIECISNEQGASRLLKKALDSGVVFSLKQIKQIAPYLDESSQMALAENVAVQDELYDSSKICEAVKELNYDSAASIFLRKSVQAGTRFSLDQIADIACFLDESGQLDLINHLSDKEIFLDSGRICSVAQEFTYDAAVTHLIRMAINNGVRFTPVQILELDVYVESDILAQMVENSIVPFTKDQLDELYGLIDDELLAKAAKRS